MRTASVKQQVLHTSFQESGVEKTYQQVTSDSLTVEGVFSAISNNKSLSLFNIIGIMSSPTSDAAESTGEILVSRMNMTRKQVLHTYQPITKCRSDYKEGHKIFSYFAWKGSIRDPQNNRHCNSKSMETSGN